MSTAEHAFIERHAARFRADVVEYYEIGSSVPHYTVRKAGQKSVANQIAAKLEPQARKDFLAALQAMQGQFDEDKFAQAWASGDTEKMLDAFAGSETATSVRPALNIVLLGFQQAGVASANALSRTMGTALGWRFDVTNSEAAQWGYVWSGELIQRISQDAKDAVKGAIGRAVGADMTRRDATLLIRSVVGLNDRQAQAVERMRSDLLATGAQASTIDTKVAGYADRLLTERASMIARTEIMSASNAGMRAAWDQAADKGVIDAKTTQRQWILTDDDVLCDECEAYDGVTVDFDDEFDEGDPPLHPGCRCTTGLVFDK